MSDNLIVHKEFGLCYLIESIMGTNKYLLITDVECPLGFENLNLKHPIAYNYLADQIKLK